MKHSVFCPVTYVKLYPIFVTWIYSTVDASVKDLTREAKTVEQQVYEHVLRDYEAAAPPRRNQSEPLVVQTRMELKQIVDLDGHTQMLTTLLYIEQIWTDEFLKWDDSHLAHVRSLRIPAKRVWTPDTFVFNNVDNTTSGFLNGIHVLVRSNGLVTMPVMIKLKTLCHVDVVLFPFDKQMCEIQLGSWSYDPSRVNYRFYPDQTEQNRKSSQSVFVDDRPANSSQAYSLYKFQCHTGDPRSVTLSTSSYWDSSDWTFVVASLGYVYRPTTQPKVWRNTDALRPTIEPVDVTWQKDLVLRLYVQRQSFFYLWNIVIPSTLLTALSSIIFWTPVKSGEKIALGLSVFLAFSMFMVLIVEEVPPGSDSIPLIGLFITTVMTLTTASVVVCVVVINVGSRGEKLTRAPRWMRAVLHTCPVRWLLSLGADDLATARKQAIVDNESSRCSSYWKKRRKLTKQSLTELQQLSEQNIHSYKVIILLLEKLMHANNPEVTKSSSFHVQNKLNFSSSSNPDVRWTPKSEDSRLEEFHVRTISVADIHLSDAIRQTSSNDSCLAVSFNTPEPSLSSNMEHMSDENGVLDQTAVNRPQPTTNFSLRSSLCSYQQLVTFEWNQISRLLDMLFFTIFLVVTCISYLVLFLLPTFMEDNVGWPAKDVC
ncbi:Neuronal acetylcholine receptor subunit alpha-2 [Clonorchis sinensis]|uniref:Neuronal acetylcholine receptor subunit alpha-2 n=2 Tax=Clonorchis sinensis TaxID=79923 RepID=A0A8T1MQH3_CLOSI|nr:Neuronal acetylcholine receptor subunit alpha-2 [Clonorchis sinensis]GAA49744.1 neuronal acetylcholine receptor subunit alpha-9-I [Clonorchis sinensis]